MEGEYSSAAGMIQVGEKLSVTQRAGPDGQIVALQGVLDGTFAPDRWPAPTGPLLIDGSQFAGADGAGLARWRALFDRTPNRDLAFVQLRLPSSQVVAFVGGGQVISVRASVRCPTCRSTADVTFDLRLPLAVFRADGPSPPCVRCGGPTTLDPGAREAVAPVLARPPPILSARISILLELAPEHGTATEHAFVARADSAAGVAALWLQGPLTDAAHLPRVGGKGQPLVLAHGVTGADPLGLRVLIEWLRSAADEVTLAGVPVVLLRALAREARALPSVIGSAIFRLDCPQGHVHASEVASVGLGRLLEAERLSAPCPTCESSGEISASREALTALGRLTLAPMSGALSTYLARPAVPGFLPRPTRARDEAPPPSADDASYEEESGSGGVATDEMMNRRESLFGSNTDLSSLIEEEPESESEPLAVELVVVPEPAPAPRAAPPTLGSVPARPTAAVDPSLLPPSLRPGAAPMSRPFLAPASPGLRVTPPRPSTGNYAAQPAPPGSVAPAAPSMNSYGRLPTLTPARVAPAPLPTEWDPPVDDLSAPTVAGVEVGEKTEPAVRLEPIKPR